jgi:hypothetical protein
LIRDFATKKFLSKGCYTLTGDKMIRAKGGKRQPRYFYLKDKGAEKLCRYMQIKRKPPKLNSIEEIKKIDKELLTLLSIIKTKYNING